MQPQPQLKLTTAQEDLEIPPNELLAHLEQSISNFDALLTDLACTPEDLHQTLQDPSTHELLKLKTHLAALQLKLLALKYVPHAFAKLINLMHTAEKPEVARRAATTVLNIAGVSTTTARQEPAPATPHEEQEQQQLKQQQAKDPFDHPQTPEDGQLLLALNFACQLQRKGVHLDQLQQNQLPALLDFLTSTLHVPYTPLD